MTIQLNHVVDLNSPDVLNWLANGATGRFVEEINETTLQNMGLKRHPGSERQVLNGTASQIKFFAARIRHYDLVKLSAPRPPATRPTSRVIQSLTVQIPLEYAIDLTMETVLFISETGLDAFQRQAIVDAYNYFPPGDDPLAYLVDKARAAGLSTNSFHVACRFTLTANSHPIPDLRQVNALEGFYRGGATVAGSSEWFKRERIELVFISEAFAGSLTNKSDDPIHEPDGSGKSDDTILDESIDEITHGVNCDDEYVRESQEIMTVFAWPEFMVAWHPEDIRLGCITVRIWLPTLLSRSSEVVLHAVVSIAKRDADATLRQLVFDCAGTSALAAGVVGVVMWNLPLAIAAFKALFENCIHVKVGQPLTCLVPDLVLINRSSDWQ